MTRGDLGRRLWGVVLLAVGAAALVPAFGPRPGAPSAGDGHLVLGLVLLGALLLPQVVVVAGARLRVAPWLVAVTTTSAVLVAAVTVLQGPGGPDAAVTEGAWRTTPAGRALGPLADAVAHLLTGPRPAPVEPVTVTPVAVLVALVSLAVGLALGRGARAALAPLVGGAALHAAGLLVTAGGGDPHGVLAAVLVAVAALGWVVLDGDVAAERHDVAPVLGEPVARRRRSRPPVLPAVGAAAVVAAVAVAGAAVPGGEPFEPREHVVPPTVDLPTGHPLSQLPAWLAAGDTELFRVTGDVPERLALLVLPDFDGAAWRAGLELRPVGAVATPGLPPGERRGRVDAVVELSGLREATHGVGDWLPTAGVARTVTAGALADVETGSLLAVGDVIRYRVVAEVDRPRPEEVRAASVPAGPDVARYLEVPRLPTDLRDLARAVTSGAGTRWDEVVALRDAVREGRDLAPDAPTGSSYARVQELLGADRADGGQVGSAEQFASAFAVLARSVGLPTRLVVGFTVRREADGRAPDASGAVVVRGRDAHVWPEVYLAGAGWVVVDPSPAHATGESGRDAGTRDLPDAPEQAAPEAAVPEEAGDGADDVAPDGPEGAEVPAPGTVVAVVAGALALVGALLLGAVALLRLRRARRWRARGAPGAWQHVEDALALAGRRVPADEPAPVVARDLGPEAVRLAARAEAAAFAPVTADVRAVPAVPTVPDDSDDASAWALATTCVTRIRSGAPAARRARWWVDPAPLRRRRSAGTDAVSGRRS